MKKIGLVYGSKDQARPFVIGTDTVYVHTEIEPATDPETGQLMKDNFKFQEVQYGKDEYLELMNQQTKALEKQNEFQEELIVELANVVYA